jgi:HAD superfamily hydrolase (TIGR01549 family)
MNIKAIFFDMDNTLVNIPNFSSEEFFLRILKRFGFYFEIEQIKQAYQSLEEWVKQNLADYTSRGRENYLEWNRLLLATLGIQKDVRMLAEKVEDCWDNLPQEVGEELYPEVREVLDWLSKNGFLLGVISNRYPELIRNSVDMHGIARYFRCLVSPQDANASRGKLDKNMWELALNTVGVVALEAAHVGDSYTHDVIGARQAGLLPIMIDREDRYSEIDCLSIKNLKELFRIWEVEV